MSKFYEWLESHDDPTNIFAPPMSDKDAIDILQQYLCDDYISVNPVGREQYNTEWVYVVLEKYSKKFRKEVRKVRRGND